MFTYEHHRFSIICSFFADNGSNKRGQISCPFVGAVERDCNFEAHLHHCSYFWVSYLVASICTIFHKRRTALCNWIVIPLSLLISLALYTSGTSIRWLSATAEPTKCTEHGAIQKGSAQCTVGTSVLVVCYTPYLIVGVVVTHSTTYSSHSSVALAVTTILVYFNSTLNPFLYCSKISLPHVR